ncbi:MAG: hypothetical protein IKG83_03215 [Prevotella sp.]|nr:hypothetical protein [Prevotella sp.]
MTDNYVNELDKIIKAFNGPSEVISFLRYEAIQNYITLTEYNLALRDALGYDDYVKVSKKIAINAFRKIVKALPESDFKKFVLENMEEIIKDGNE